MDATIALMLIEALLIILAIAIYKAIRFIFPSLGVFHPVVVDDSCKDVVVSISTASSSFDIIGAPPTTKYDVFLSFRGEDTRDNFTSYLYEALCKANIETFMDHKLQKGEQISPILLRTIEESEISVVVFSKDYASSTWCLDELVKILECKYKYGRVVIPIFYNVDPSNIRKQSGSYADAFTKLKQRFKHNQDKVQMWRDALIQSASLSGWDSKNIRPESKLIKNIVKDILSKLNRMSSCHFEGLVGIDHQIEKIEELLFDSRVVGIWGMGGVGKTTLAKVVFHKLKAQFETFSFVKNVSEQLARIGFDKLQEECLKELLKDKDIDIYNMKSTFVKSRLQRKRILLVLDDVDNLIRAEDLTKVCDWFGEGSRIIITSRDLQVLKNASASKSSTYHVQGLDFHDALHLFSLKAFKQNKPIKSYMKLSEWIVGYCQGNPLALVVLGCFLYDRRKEEWESAMENLEEAPHEYIFNVLKLSFDGLNDKQKNIFLDLAYFSRERSNLSWNFIRDLHGSSAYIEICVLKEKSLILDEFGVIKMHDLVRKMGHEIARQLNFDTGKPIRLWRHEDIYHFFINNKEIETIRYISLDMCKTEKIILTASAFQKMYDLRFLEFYKSDFRKPSKVYIFEGLDSLPKTLKFLFWEEYPLPSVPLSFCSENLIELAMPKSHLQQLWDGNQCFPNLRIIDLFGSKDLVGLPDLSQAPNITSLHLDGCVNLTQIHSSSVLGKFPHLWMQDCQELRRVNIGNIKGRSSGLVAVYNFLDLNYFSFNKVIEKFFVSDDGNVVTGFRFKVVSVSFTQISECIDNIESAKLKLLIQRLASLLPFVRRLRWLDIPIEFGNFKEHFDYLSHYIENTRYPHWEGEFHELRAEAREPSRVVGPLISEWATREEVTGYEEGRPLEVEEELMTEVECCSNSSNRMTTVPNSITRWSLLTKLSLQKSDIIGSAAWSIPDLSILKSLAESDCRRLQPLIDVTLSLDILGTFWGGPSFGINYSRKLARGFNTHFDFFFNHKSFSYVSQQKKQNIKQTTISFHFWDIKRGRIGDDDF